MKTRRVRKEDLKGFSPELGESRPVRVGIYDCSFEKVSVSVACDRAKMACDIKKEIYQSAFSRFDRSLHNTWTIESYVLDNLDRALEEEWIQVWYQPIIRSTTGMVCNEEALARWIDPERGMFSPADFIPVLEEARMIHRLDLHIVELVLRDMKTKQKTGMAIVPVSVNLSWHDFESCDILTEICSRMDREKVPYNMLNIEITESTVAKNPEYMALQIKRFHRFGFQVWMDDFGSGYSSLDYLKNYEFDLIKFDMQFMKDFNTLDKSRIILSELTHMALKLGVDTLAEGVETPEQISYLREIGCNKLQGYFFNKPNSLENVQKIWREGKGRGIEDLKAAAYYDRISRISLNDLSIAEDINLSVRRFYSTIPMAIFEVRGDNYHILRYNESFKEHIQYELKGPLPEVIFLNKLLEVHPEPLFETVIRKAIKSESWEYQEEVRENNVRLNAFAKKLMNNPVTDADSVVMFVLSVLNN